MNAWLFENPLLIGFLGVLLALMVGYVWLQTSHRTALYLALALLTLTIIMVMINVTVVSDRERIVAILFTVADALGKNDHPTVLAIIHPTAAETVLRAKAELPNYKFSEARITGIKDIRVNRSSKPATAIAEFNVFVALTLEHTQFDVRRFVRVYFMQRGDRWFVHNYEHFEPTAGFREQVATEPTQSPMEMWQKFR